MIIELDVSSPVPAYEQLRHQIRAMIVSGVRAQGEQLPVIRRLADDLELSPGTVARAYRELEADGLVTARGRKGTHVAATDKWSGEADPEGRLQRAAHDFVIAARQVGAPRDVAVNAIRHAFEEPAVQVGD